MRSSSSSATVTPSRRPGRLLCPETWTVSLRKGGMRSTTSCAWRCGPPKMGTRSRDRFVVWNPHGSESHPPRLEHILDPALPQPLPPEDSRHPVRRGQPLRPSHPRNPGSPPENRRKGIPQRRARGRDRDDKGRDGGRGSHEARGRLLGRKNALATSVALAVE